MHQTRIGLSHSDEFLQTLIDAFQVWNGHPEGWSLTAGKVEDKGEFPLREILLNSPRRPGGASLELCIAFLDGFRAGRSGQ